MSENILEAQGLVKRYGGVEAVRGLSFAVRRGEVFGLLGPNGAGKTTVISMLTGILPPTSGTARVGGYDIVKELDQVKKINGLVPQDLALYPTLSARANLNFFGRIYGLRGRELGERVEDVLRIVALTDRADDAIKTFSGGMKRRVNIAAGLVHQPKLLFLDEPTVGVDPQSRNHIFESVMRLNRERGMSIVYTSHYMEEVELLCNRVAIIDQGKIVALDTIKNLIAMLGGGVIQVGLHQVDDALLAQLATLPAVKRATLAPQPAPPPPAEGQEAKVAEIAPAPGYTIVKIEAEHSQQALVNMIGFFNERDISIAALEILEPNLESVFLHLTGKKLRE
ncbi:MAG: ATP-binding cassette domain-containing protein [Anaerolineae bacterium]|nr:ATP-binding cassette domain-containing protein [Anaerolineae bacterium]